MKHLITLSACMMILLALLSQFVQNQKLLIQLEQGSRMADLFCDNGDELFLRTHLGEIMDCNSEEIQIEKEEDRVVIAVPVRGILASPEFWGIDPEFNQGVYRWERVVSDG